MSTSPAKRRRVDDDDGESSGRRTQPASVVPAAPLTERQSMAQISSWIDLISYKDVKRLLCRAVVRDPETAREMSMSVQAIEAAERARFMDFDPHSEDAWQQLNTRYSSNDVSKQYEVSAAIEGILDSILENTWPHSSYGTKKSAVETMCKIFKNLLLSTGELSNQVRRYCVDWDRSFVQMLAKLDKDEQWQLATDDDGEWLKKFIELVQMANDQGLFQRLRDVLDDLQKTAEGVYGDEKDDGGKENEEGEGEEKGRRRGGWG